MSREAGEPADAPVSLLLRALERRRVEAGASTKGFADRLGISRSYYSLLRRGKRRPGPRLRQRLHERFPELRAVAADPAPGESQAELLTVLDSWLGHWLGHWLGEVRARLLRMEARHVRIEEGQTRIEATLEALRGPG